MKTDLYFGVTEELLNEYIKQFVLYPRNKVGELAEAKKKLLAVILELESIAINLPPCNNCKYKDEPPTFRLCCDCEGNGSGWSEFCL